MLVGWGVSGPADGRDCRELQGKVGRGQAGLGSDGRLRASSGESTACGSEGSTHGKANAGPAHA